MLTPLVRLVSSRIRSLNRSTAFGAIRRFGIPALVKLNPRNFGSHRLAALYPDEVIAGILNRQGRKTANRRTLYRQSGRQSAPLSEHSAFPSAD